MVLRSAHFQDPIPKARAQNKKGNTIRIITISREFGSGGRELGKRLADHLGYAYYDKEIAAVVAKDSGRDEGHIERLVATPRFRMHPITIGHTSFMNRRKRAEQAASLRLL